MQLHTHTHMNIYIYTYIYIYLYLYTYIYIYVYTYLYTYKCVYINMYMQIYTYFGTLSFICIYICANKLDLFLKLNLGASWNPAVRLFLNRRPVSRPYLTIIQGSHTYALYRYNDITLCIFRIVLNKFDNPEHRSHTYHNCHSHYHQALLWLVYSCCFPSYASSFFNTSYCIISCSQC